MGETSPGFICRQKMHTGEGFRLFVFQPGIDAVAAACGLIAAADFYVMLSEILAVFAHWVIHIITSYYILEFITLKVNRVINSMLCFIVEVIQ